MQRTSFFSFRLNTKKKLSHRFNLILGAEFDPHLDKALYEAIISDFYTGEIVEYNIMEGNKTHAIGFSAGIDFR